MSAWPAAQAFIDVMLAGEHAPSFDTWNLICKTFGWPQTFGR
jgi:hypothetical protein